MSFLGLLFPAPDILEKTMVLRDDILTVVLVNLTVSRAEIARHIGKKTRYIAKTLERLVRSGEFVEVSGVPQKYRRTQKKHRLGVAGI